MAYYTIKQLADTFEVSRQAIQFLFKKDEYKPYLSKQRVGGRTLIVINDKGYQLLKNHFAIDGQNEQAKQTTDTNKTNNTNTKYTSKEQAKQTNNALLLDTIETLKKELEHAHDELDKVHTELQHEQELHLIDKKQLTKEREHVGLLETQVKELQAIQTKQANDKQDQQTSNTSDTSKEDNLGKEKATKKWWQFWK